MRKIERLRAALFAEAYKVCSAQLFREMHDLASSMDYDEEEFVKRAKEALGYEVR